MHRRKATRRPLRTHAAIEPLEPRAMLAGVGPESWSAAGLAPAPFGTEALLSSGVILTCSSPGPGSSCTASPPTPAAGSGGSPFGSGLWIPSTSGSGAVSGSTATAATSGVVTNGPALSSQTTGNAGGQSVGTTTGATSRSYCQMLCS